MVRGVGVMALARDLSARSQNGRGRRLRDRVADALNTLSRRAPLALLAIVATVLAAHAQGADPYPSRPITLVVPFAPSGGNDIMARLVGERMGKALGQQIVVENRAGAGGNIGSRQAARSAPDGYTMLLAFTGTIGINPSLYANLGYDPAKELTPIGSIATSPAVLVVHPSLPVKTLQELIAYAKANPGQLSYASSGVGPWSMSRRRCWRTPPASRWSRFRTRAPVPGSPTCSEGTSR
jgi:Tripartite tricarboxylate transporter family receptor